MTSKFGETPNSGLCLIIAIFLTGENKQIESDITLKSNSKKAQFDELDVVASAILFMVAGKVIIEKSRGGRFL